MSKTESSSLTGFDGGEPGADLLAAHRQALEILRNQHFCTYGQYPWDFWEKRALARGVPGELANLGRAVMREADQHLTCLANPWTSSPSPAVNCCGSPAIT